LKMVCEAGVAMMMAVATCEGGAAEPAVAADGASPRS
jgi:hypothetical protein